MNYPPLEVYENLHHLLRHRNLVLKSSSHIEKPRTADLVPGKKFINDIQWSKFIILEAVDAEDKVRKFPPRIHEYCHKLKTITYIVIMDNDVTVHSSEIDQFTSKIPDIELSIRNSNIDIIIISNQYITTYATKKMKSYVSAGTETAGYVQFVNELYTTFNFDLLSRSSASKHRILPVEEEVEIIKTLGISKQYMEKITQSDVISIILGAVVGDVIEIIGFNENTSVEKHYRVVKS